LGRSFTAVKRREFPNFRPVEISDAGLFEELLARDQPVTSELTFANIYLWRRVYEFEMCWIDDGIAVRGVDRDRRPFLLPPIGVSDPVAVADRMASFERLSRVPQHLAESLETLGLRVTYDRDNSDYVYLADDLINLPGRKYHRKRNHLAKFKEEFKYEYRRVTPDLIDGCRRLQETWCDVRDCFVPENASLADEHYAVNEALTLLEPLRLTAGAIIIEDKVAAFAIGGELNRRTFVVHFEKANPNYPGIYQVINREFAADAAAGFTFINREQDLGQEGLRRAKESYFPDHLENKYGVERG
jgi:hypothetical protein